MTEFDEPIQPCPQMRILLSRLSDGTLAGLARWYAEQHTARCEHCSQALKALLALRTQLRQMGVPTIPGGLSLERHAALEKAWDEIDNAA